VIVVGLPSGGRQSNDKRYPIAVLGTSRRGLLTSDSTRIPGLVSIADVAPTALGTDEALGSQAANDPVARVLALDREIRDNATGGLAGALIAAVLILLLAWLRPRAAALGFATGLAANLALGLAGVTDPWAAAVTIGLAIGLGAPLLALWVDTPVAVGAVLAAVLVAYLVALGVDGTAVALSPFGPQQNSRFYGVSNLLETMLLVPAFGAAALLFRRFGWGAFAAVALVAFVTVAGDRFGADGGGAIVLGVGYAVLAVLLAGGGRRALAGAVVGAAALVVLLVGLDAATGGSSHVTRSLRRGPVHLAEDLRDRVALSYDRAVVHWYVALLVAAGLAALVLLAVRLSRSDAPRADQAVPLAIAAAVATSLVVNDSPAEVIVCGLVGFVAALPGRLARDASPPPPARARLAARRGRLRRREDSRAPA
jgi:hypothetical protein